MKGLSALRVIEEKRSLGSISREEIKYGKPAQVLGTAVAASGRLWITVRQWYSSKILKDAICMLIRNLKKLPTNQVEKSSARPTTKFFCTSRQPPFVPTISR